MVTPAMVIWVTASVKMTTCHAVAPVKPFDRKSIIALNTRCPPEVMTAQQQNLALVSCKFRVSSRVVTSYLSEINALLYYLYGALSEFGKIRCLSICATCCESAPGLSSATIRKSRRG